MISEGRSGNEYLQCSCYLYLLESQLFGGKKTVFRRNIYIVSSIKESWLKSVLIIFALEEFKSISGDVVDTDTNTAEIYRKRVTETDRINNGNYQAVELECPTDLSESGLPLGLGVFLDIESTDFSAARTQDDSSTSDDDGDDDDDDDDDEYADATDDINGNIYLVNDQSTTFEREPNVAAENVEILTNTEETDKDEKEKTTSNNSDIGEEKGQGEEGIEKEGGGGGGGGEKIEEKETEEKREEKEEEREEKEKQEEQEEKEKEEEIKEKEEEIEEKEKEEEREEKEKEEERKEKVKDEEREEKEKVEKQEEKEKEEEKEENALAVVVEQEEEEEEKVGERKINKPQKTSRKKRRRNRRKSRKRRTKPPQLRETPSSGDACAMSTRTTSTVVSATRPLTLPLSLALPLTLPIRPLSLSPLHDGPIKTTTPDSTRSLYPMPTLAVINEQEGIDDEPLNANETQKEIDANSIKDKQRSPRSPRTPKLSPTSAILNDNIHGRISLNDNNTIPDDNINNNTTNNNDNNNNKNNICKIITSDFEEINADYNYDRHYADNNDSHIEFKNEYLNNNNRLAANFPGLYRLENSAEGYSGEINASPGLEGVKAMANRLNLATRRPSYQQWRDRYFGSGGVPRFPDLSPEELTAEKLTEERKGRINGALEWIKNELGQMRAVDHNLATQLLTLRNDISRLKLERSCESHQDLLDDVKDELSDRETISAVSDIPYDMVDDNPLKHLGVTRMNISSRRFSMC